MILCSFPYFPYFPCALFLIFRDCKASFFGVTANQKPTLWFHPIAILTLKSEFPFQADVSHQAIAEKTESSEVGTQTGDGSHVAFVFPPDLPNLWCCCILKDKLREAPKMTSLYSISLLYNFSNISNLSNCSKFTWALLCFEVFY